MLTVVCESNITNVIAEDYWLPYRLPVQFDKYAQAFQYARMLSKGLWLQQLLHGDLDLQYLLKLSHLPLVLVLGMWLQPAQC